MNADPMGDRRHARARLQRLRHHLRLELIRPAPAKLPWRTFEALATASIMWKVRGYRDILTAWRFPEQAPYQIHSWLLEVSF
ncbi:hypothetical protein I6F07_30500 [Ensifer sp. IC4062]|nr:hypothetical protein [Ensifer sp. IC4062]MCA1444441.1 hypothetical protein [Ensifer sp. IC4062]